MIVLRRPRQLFFLFVALAAIPAAHAERRCDTESKVEDGYHLSAWTSDNFAGKNCRSWKIEDGKVRYLYLDIDMSEGGYDAGAGRTGLGTKVDDLDIKTGMYWKHEKIELDGDGHWWAGPKTVLSDEAKYIGLKGQNECYVVENAKMSPEEIVKWAKLKYRGEGTFDGEVYKHYTVDYEGIDQIWSIRQTYRREGWTSVGYMVAQWRQLGLCDNRYCLGWKTNIELNGPQKGEFGFTAMNLPKP